MMAAERYILESRTDADADWSQVSWHRTAARAEAAYRRFGYAPTHLLRIRKVS